MDIKKQHQPGDELMLAEKKRRSQGKIIGMNEKFGQGEDNKYEEKHSSVSKIMGIKENIGPGIN